MPAASITSRWLMPTTAWTSFLRARGLPRKVSSGSGISPTYSRWSTLDLVASATAARMISCCVAVGVLAIGVFEVSLVAWYAESQAPDEVTTDFRLADALVALAGGTHRHRDRLRSRDPVASVGNHRDDVRGRIRRHPAGAVDPDARSGAGAAQPVQLPGPQHGEVRMPVLRIRRKAAPAARAGERA